MGSEPNIKFRNRVELHVHLDGSMRPQTVLECARRRGIQVPSEDLDEFCKLVQLCDGECDHLNEFLKIFSIVVPAVAGDEESLRRIAYEFCEDKAKQGVLYCEVRYSPHLLANSMKNPEFASSGDVTPDRVVKVISEGLSSGATQFGIRIRTILCCMRHRPEWAEETLALCVKYRDSNVVAIDVAGPENMDPLDPAHQQHIRVFQEAERLGINRTMHAGECGPASNVIEAIEHMRAQRIGHGYSTVDDDALYRQVLARDIHLEICPWSSLLVSSLKRRKLVDLLLRLVKDKANMSINTDDPAIFNKTLSDEYDLVKWVGLTDLNIAQANFDAARSAFLPLEEKNALIEELKKTYDEETLRQIRF